MGAQAFKDRAMVVAWLTAITLVAYQSLAWSYKPGEKGSGPKVMPTGKGLRAVILVHPECPCTEATLKLFSDAVRLSRKPVKSLIVVPAPARESKNVALARTVPNAQVEFRPASEIDKEFGISTSGHVLVWKGNRLIFSGGITDARGEEMRASSFNELTMALHASKVASETPVFGCAAFDREVSP